MMKHNIRLIALLLSLVMLLGIFAACNTTPPVETTQQEETTEAPTPERTAIDLIVSGESTVRIIRPQNLTSGDAAVEAAVLIRNKIENSTGVRLDIVDDFKKPTESYDDSTVEILVGNTAYPQTEAAIEGLKFSDYVIKLVGNKIVIFGYTDDAMKAAATAFVQLVAQHAVTDDNKISSVSIPLEELNVAKTHSGSKLYGVLPSFDGATFYATYKSNTDCNELILKNVTAESYVDYVSKLTSAGFIKYTSNDMNGNLFTTLYNSEYTLNVGFYKPYKECRIVIEPYADSTLIGTEAKPYTAVTTSQLTMIGCEYKNSEGKIQGNGLSLLFRLADGSFVIVDGGHNTEAHASNLVKAIKEQAKDYASGKNIRIAAWFISHAHGDHDGVIRGKTSYFSQFTVERVIACFMTDEERAISASVYSNNFSIGEGGSDDADRAAAASLGADFIVCHTGQRFYFADSVFEILYTVENYGPTTVNALNTSTSLVKVTTTDPKTGSSTTTMVMGDVTGPAMAICNKLYGTWMKSDIVQVAHHGYTTWGNDAAMATAYKYMSPEIVLWPQGNNAFPNYKEKSYNKVLWDGTNKNFKQMYVAGWIGSQYIVPLPYSGDTATITQKPVKQP